MYVALCEFFENSSMNPVSTVPSNLLYSAAKGLPYTRVVTTATSTCANCSLRTKLMSPLETSTASRPLQRALSSHTTHSLPCRYGSTPLNDAINKTRATLLPIYGASARPHELRSRRSCVSVGCFVNFPCDIAVLRARAKRERRILISLHVKRSHCLFTWQEGPKSALARCRLLL